MENSKTNKSMLDRFLSGVEYVGNKIPDPILLFIYFCIATILASFLLSLINFSDINPATNEVVEVVNLLSKDGLIRMLTTAITNFTGLSALGMVLVCMLGVGVADRSGLFSVTLNSIVKKSAGSDIKVIMALILACVLADAAGGTGFVVMPPLGALVFLALGRNPIVGMLAAYATVSGAFASNILITSMDVINLSFTETAAHLVNPDIPLSPAINYYFSAFSVITLTAMTLFITLKVVEPRLGEWKGSKGGSNEIMDEIGPKEKKALSFAGIAVLILVGLVVLGTVPADGMLRDPETGSAIVSSAPLMRSLPLLIALVFFIPGVVFGLKSEKFKDFTDIATALGEAMSDMGPYIALIFFIAQFLKYFEWSNIGIILAIKGANILKSSNLPVAAIFILFIIMSSLINVIIGSASSKWAILSPIFVPMFMFLGYHPGVTQMAYRIGDAITNPICPTFAYFGMLLALAKTYDKEIGMGTLMANMLPYTLGFGAFMLIQFLIWFLLGIPFGPGAPLLL